MKNTIKNFLVNKVVINLPERTDRLIEFKEEYSKHFDLKDLTVLEAVKGIPGFRYIAKSHKAAIALAKEKGWPEVLIFEDDFLFVSNNSYQYILDAYSNKPDEYDMLFFGAYFKKGEIDYNDYWVTLKDHCGAHCYLVNQSAYDTILNYNESNHIDRWYTAKSGLKCFTTKKLPTKQRNGLSNNTGREENYDSILNNYKLI